MQAVTAVVVFVLQVFGHQLQAVGASLNLVGVVRIHRGAALVAAERMVAGGVVDYGIVSVDTS